MTIDELLVVDDELLRRLVDNDDYQKEFLERLKTAKEVILLRPDGKDLGIYRQYKEITRNYIYIGAIRYGYNLKLCPEDFDHMKKMCGRIIEEHFIGNPQDGYRLDEVTRDKLKKLKV